MKREELRKVKIVSSTIYNALENGYFHCWEKRPDYTDGGTFEITLGIVEIHETGKIVECRPDSITFVENF
jgi:hypothetical protein